MNQIILIGRVGKDPEFKKVGKNNTSLATFSMATSKNIGSYKEQNWVSTWHNIKCWSKTADSVIDEVRKGDEVFVQGELEDESWEDKDTGKKMHKAVITGFIIRVTKQGDNGGSQQQDDDPGPQHEETYEQKSSRPNGYKQSVDRSGAEDW